MLLFPDPRPLVERLGVEFFRALPQRPGVYLMRDAQGCALYVGKAINLRRRLGSYRVANPDRMAARHLRLLRNVARIDFEECEDEQAALAVEARLLQSLRPKFNRAGTWPRAPRLLGWRLTGDVLEFAELDAPLPPWRCLGPFYGAWRLRDALARVFWRAVHANQTLAALPHGWIGSGASGRRRALCHEKIGLASGLLENLAAGKVADFVQSLSAAIQSPAAFETGLLAEDLQTIETILRRSVSRHCEDKEGLLRSKE